MAYSSGGLIEATDYNTFATNLNSIWSTGSGTSGWGQTSISSVAGASPGPAGTVTATNWATLVNNLASAGTQTNSTITSRTAPVTGNVIAVLNNIATDITTCTNNRGNSYSQGTTSSTWTGSTAKITATPGSTSTAAWTITFQHIITFASANQARYFWNAGGQLRLDMAKSSTGTSNDNNWNSFITTIGAIIVSGRPTGVDQTINGTVYGGTTKVGGSGTPTVLASTTGYWQITPNGGFTTLFQQFGLSPYTGEYVQVSGAVDLSGAVFTFQTVWVQPAVSGAGQTTDISGGTDTTSPFSIFGTAPAVLCRYIPPKDTTSGGVLTNTWGAPTIQASAT